MKFFKENNLAYKEEGVEQSTLIGNYEQFMVDLKARAAEAKPEEVQRLLTELERFSQSPDRTIEVYTDPELDTFCCGQVPSKTVNRQGEIVDDPTKKTYLIGLPFLYVGGQAPLGFLRGEILHEQGHAKWTDFSRSKRFEALAHQDGQEPTELHQLNNCIEDPRMERLVGGPRFENERRQLFEKNGRMIIPNIAKGIKAGNMPVNQQFKFILKLERLWALHENELKGQEKPWSLDDLDPKALVAYQQVAPALAKITGDAVRPAMKVNPEVEKIIVEEIWPVYKRLLTECPPQQQEPGKGRKGGDGSGQGDPEGEPFDPHDPNSWPPEMQKFFKKMVEQHNQRLQQKADRAKQEAAKLEGEKERRDQAKHELLKSRDGFSDPKLREEYNRIKSEVQPVISQLKRIFDRFLPKVDEPQYEWGKKGIRFDVKRYVRRIGTGYEEPMGRRLTPEKNMLVLQILVDVSGSMYSSKERIENTVKACVAICEAAQDYNIAIEILANDEGNVSTDNKFLIKSFDDEFNGKTKSKVAIMLDLQQAGFGGGNEDGAAIRAAIPRMRRKIQSSRAAADRIASLGIYISDSTTQSADTKQAAEEVRQYTPFEGTAITPEAGIPEGVRFHFGPQSIIPKSVNEFPAAIQEILARHISKLKPRE